MWTISFIRAHINRVPDNVPFSTRDCLCYGTRAAVDTALHRLVKQDIIIRLARGVFIKWSLVIAKGGLPSAEAVAKTKARGFGKEIFVHKQDAAFKFGLIEHGNESPTFGTFGRSTSFQFGDKRIKLQHGTPKDAKPGDTFVGLLIRALRGLGYQDELPTTVTKLLKAASKVDKTNLALAAAAMPSWLSDLFCSESIAISRIKSLTLA
jgi:hypothetical protein